MATGPDISTESDNDEPSFVSDARIHSPSFVLTTDSSGIVITAYQKRDRLPLTYR